jgi:ketosteroid isomerase-like protein
MAQAVSADALELTRRFIEALNARDLESLRELVSDDVALPTRDGRELSGEDGLGAVVQTAADNDLVLVREGAEDLDDSGGVTRVAAPVRVRLGSRDEMHGSAVFEVRDGRISAFRVQTAL